MGARILILQDTPSTLKALRKSLEGYHTLVFVEDTEHALKTLHEQHFDLIISRVHLEKSNVFDFLKAVKDDEKLSTIPFICFCGIRTARARLMNAVLSETSRVLGADHYINLDDFCRGNECDLDGLRQVIESYLKPALRS